jgi:hypothetical protein
MLVQRTESNKCLLYLNTLLLNRLRETGDQNLSLSQFSPTFFRKERVISLGGEESELLLTIDEVYNHNEELLQKNYELEADLADALMSQRCADGENSLNPNYSENPGSFFNANEQLQPNILGFKKPVTNLVQPFDQHHQSLNPTKLQKQNSFASNFSGRSVQRKKIKSEDLSAGERDNEQQLEWLRSKIQEFSSDVI